MQLRQNLYRRHHIVSRWLITIGIILVIVIGVLIIFGKALSPARNAREKYEPIAAKVGLTEPSDFLVSKRNTVYYSVIGENKKKQQIAVIMPAQKKPNPKAATTVMLKDGLSYQQVVNRVWAEYKPKKVLSIGLTLYKGYPAWDVSFTNQKNNLNFVTLQFTDGKELKLIQNL
ncbi:hypothetical protein EQG49_10365 [Periweissella cryptocerci]|uniref:Cell wall elongation regulator TseB-like domain-containing protein n=1 Tax=Periweissella cryptocerci TaxID=2506420 RepID=A0A4P6YVN7_9LACO|nr:DUF5590 domain-containing protein [Periweissella cryptocerci]QBO36816.1 hypothetical protein EQG49_10365 [Periweissella cryptocerci]